MQMIERRNMLMPKRSKMRISDNYHTRVVFFVQQEGMSSRSREVDFQELILTAWIFGSYLKIVTTITRKRTLF